MSVLHMLAEITIYSAVIFAAIVLLRLAFRKKLSPALKYALWFVLIARLLLPVTFESDVRLSSLPETENITAAFAQTEQTESVAAETTTDAANTATESEISEDVGLPAQADPIETATARPTTEQVLLSVWLGGAAIVGGWMLLSYVLLWRKIRHDAVEPTAKLTAMLDEVKTELGIRRKIRMVCQYAYGAPAMMFPRTLWIPLGGIVAMSDTQAMDALRHELTHEKRADPPASMLLAALCAVYWFNPVVWAAAYLMRTDMETACDAMVTQRYSLAQRSEYANLLLNLYAQPALGVPALGLSGHGAKRQAKRRVTGLFQKQTSTPGAKIVAVLLTLVLLFGCFTTACQAADDSTARELSASEYPWPMDIAMEAVDRVDTEAEQITTYATFAVHADVRQPEDANPSVIHMTRNPMTDEEILALLEKLKPDADWTITEPDGTCKCFGTGTTTDGVTFTRSLTAIYDSSAVFRLTPEGMTVYAEQELINGADADKIPVDAFEQPIELTAKEAQKQADKVVDTLGATNVVLQAAERACMFETDEDGTLSVVSSGWDFVYVPVGGDLPCIYIGGQLYGDSYNGRFYYDESMYPLLRVYVDDSGMQRIDLVNMPVQSEVLQENVPIISYEVVLEQVKEEMAVMFGKTAYFPWAMLKQSVEVNVTSICLCSAVVGEEAVAGEDLLNPVDSAEQLIPVWQIVCTVAYEGKESLRAIELRYSAVDGLPLMIRW